MNLNEKKPIDIEAEKAARDALLYGTGWVMHRISEDEGVLSEHIPASEMARDAEEQEG